MSYYYLRDVYVKLLFKLNILLDTPTFQQCHSITIRTHTFGGYTSYKLL